MLMPNDGHFDCQQCNFSTCDLFEYMEHCGVNYTWGVRLNKTFTFNLFDFLQYMNQRCQEDDYSSVFDSIQSATLLLVNASGEELSHFIEEAMVATEMINIDKEIKQILREEND